MSKITITIEIEDGEVTVKSGKKEDETPFCLEPDSEEIPNRPVTTFEGKEDIMLEQANRFADQFANELSASPVVGPSVVDSLASEEVLSAIDVAASEEK